MQHPPDAVEANRATYWYPILQQSPLAERGDLIPDAKLIEMRHDFREYLAVYEGDLTEEEDIPQLDYLTEAVENYGTPCFIRSDLSSAKHFGIKGIKAETPDDVPTVTGCIIEHHGMDFLGPNPTHWMIRPWIEMDAKLTKTGYFNKPGLPIPPEYRVFATSDGDHVCTHWYWIEAEILKNSPQEDAKEQLAKMRDETVGATAHLNKLATIAAEELGKSPAWSVDFALGKDGNWRLIDVADSRTSWHPETCPHHEDLMKGTV